MKAIIRGDFDGIVCSTILKATGLIDEVEMVKIKDLTDGKVKVTDNDIVCNLPYQPDAFLWFDHHSSESKRTPDIPIDYRGGFNLAPSATEVVYQYFLPFHPHIKRFAELVRDTDILDSADLTKEEVFHPTGNLLLGLLLDPRTGLDRVAGLEQEYEAWKYSIPGLLCDHDSEEILAMPEAKKWQDVYWENQESAIKTLINQSELIENVIFSDFRDVNLEPINRFILYALPEFESGNVSVQISVGDPGVWNEISVGHSIFNRSSMVDVGDLCAWYGGGGHRSVGVCRPSEEDTEQVLSEIIASCKEPLPS
ncbi:MAG: hypothetical protein KAU50_09870 [Candidatus Marinimicrobia bacterium]|nr:hypothetical protein [Candidatus Neomarinimicrobiota bacterium]